MATIQRSGLRQISYSPRRASHRWYHGSMSKKTRKRIGHYGRLAVFLGVALYLFSFQRQHPPPADKKSSKSKSSVRLASRKNEETTTTTKSSKRKPTTTGGPRIRTNVVEDDHDTMYHRMEGDGAIGSTLTRPMFEVKEDQDQDESTSQEKGDSGDDEEQQQSYDGSKASKNSRNEEQDATGGSNDKDSADQKRKDAASGSEPLHGEIFHAHDETKQRGEPLRPVTGVSGAGEKTSGYLRPATGESGSGDPEKEEDSADDSEAQQASDNKGSDETGAGPEEAESDEEEEEEEEEPEGDDDAVTTNVSRKKKQRVKPKKNDDCLVLVQLAKSGGTVLLPYLKYIANKQNWKLKTWAGADVESAVKRAKKQQPTSKYAKNYLHRGPLTPAALEATDTSNCRRVVVLRNPLDRVISLYTHYDVQSHGQNRWSACLGWSTTASKDCAGALHMYHNDVARSLTADAVVLPDKIFKLMTSPSHVSSKWSYDVGTIEKVPDLDQAKQFLRDSDLVCFHHDLQSCVKRLMHEVVNVELTSLTESTMLAKLHKQIQTFKSNLQSEVDSKVLKKLKKVNGVDLELFEWAQQQTSSKKSGPTHDQVKDLDESEEEEDESKEEDSEDEGERRKSKPLELYRTTESRQHVEENSSNDDNERAIADEEDAAPSDSKDDKEEEASKDADETSKDSREDSKPSDDEAAEKKGSREDEKPSADSNDGENDKPSDEEGDGSGNEEAAKASEDENGGSRRRSADGDSRTKQSNDEKDDAPEKKDRDGPDHEDTDEELAAWADDPEPDDEELKRRSDAIDAAKAAKDSEQELNRMANDEADHAALERHATMVQERREQEEENDMKAAVADIVAAEDGTAPEHEDE